MRQKIFFLLFILISIPLFAKELTPAWVRNLQQVYPNEKFIAQKGEGKKSEVAKNDALGNLARYFKTSINASIITDVVLTEIDGREKEQITVFANSEVTSNINLSCVEFSEIYYDKKSRKFLCVAFIAREKAWVQLVPVLDAESGAVISYIKEAIKLSNEDAILAKKYFSNVKNEAEIFSDILEYTRLISPGKSKKYSQVLDEVKITEKNILDNLSRCTFCVIAENDFQKIVQSCFESILTEKGFLISNQNENPDYIVKIKIDKNFLTGDMGKETEFYSCSPSAVISVENVKTGNYVLSFNSKVHDVEVSYSEKIVLEKGYRKIANQLGEDFYNSNFF